MAQPESSRTSVAPSTRMPRRRRWLLRAALVSAALVAYPAFVLGTVYAHWMNSGLPGGEDGPADAYRHTLASATVAYTGSPRWVEWVTALMEDDGRGNASRAMDAHNNRIGERIGAHARSWQAMQRDVFAAVEAGDVDSTDTNRITWLPPARWRDRLY